MLDDSLSPEEHLNLGVAYEKKAEYEPAVAEYQKASKQINLAYVYLGNIYFQKGDYEKAERSYEKAITKIRPLLMHTIILPGLLFKKGTPAGGRVTCLKSRGIGPKKRNISRYVS